MKLVYLTWDRTNNRLLDAAGQGVDASWFRWYRGDEFALCLTCVKYDSVTNAYVADAIAITSTFQLMIKLGRFATGSQDGTTQLAFSDADQWDTGVWADEDASHHSVIVALTETALNTLLTITSAPISPILEITETAVDASHWTVEQQITITPDINRGGTTTTVAPDYLTAAQVTALLASMLKIAAGKRWVVNADGTTEVEDV